MPELSEPLRGWRRADLLLDDHPNGPFMALTADTRFGIDTDATCRAFPRRNLPGEVQDALETLRGYVLSENPDPILANTANTFREIFEVINEAGHDAPAVGCKCGFYAMERRVDVPGRVARMGPEYRSGNVLLEVELSGTVDMHELGVRASHQRVIAAYVQPRPACGHVNANVLIAEPKLLVVCSYCFNNHDGHVELADIAGHVGVEVRWAEDSDWPYLAGSAARSQYASRAYQAAMRTVRERHRAEFDELRARISEQDHGRHTGANIYGRAAAEVRERHRAEFDEVLLKERATYGLDLDQQAGQRVRTDGRRLMRARAYQAALRTVRERHRAEFGRYLTALWRDGVNNAHYHAAAAVRDAHRVEFNATYTRELRRYGITSEDLTGA